MNQLDKIIEQRIRDEKIEFFSNNPDIIKISKNVFLRQSYVATDDIFVKTGRWVVRGLDIYEPLEKIGDCNLNPEISDQLSRLSFSFSNKKNTENANNFAKQICDDLMEQIDEVKNEYRKK